AEDRFDHSQEIKLVVAPKESFAEDWPKTPSCRDELSANFVAVRIANNTEHVGRLRRHLETRRVRIFASEMCRDAIAGPAFERGREKKERERRDDAEEFHEAALRYCESAELQFRDSSVTV